MAYTVTITKRASKQLRKLDGTIRPRIVAAINALGEDPRPDGVVKLAAERGYRIQVGRSYRVLYTIDDGIEVVEVRRVGTRENFY